MGDYMRFGVQWYYWLILLAAIILLFFVWRKAMAASKARRERLKKEAAIWKRDYELREKFSILTESKIKETEDLELLHGIAMNIQVMLEKEIDMNTAFSAMPIEKQYVYCLEYYDEDAKNSLSAFFKNNGAPLVPIIPQALTAIGLTELLPWIELLIPMYDPDSLTSIDYDAIAKADEEFKEAFNSDKLCRSAALYIRENIKIFLS